MRIGTMCRLYRDQVLKWCAVGGSMNKQVQRLLQLQRAHRQGSFAPSHQHLFYSTDSDRFIFRPLQHIALGFWESRRCPFNSNISVGVLVRGAMKMRHMKNTRKMRKNKKTRKRRKLSEQFNPKLVNIYSLLIIWNLTQTDSCLCKAKEE